MSDVSERISLIEPDSPAGKTGIRKVLFAGVEQLLGRIPNSFKMAAHAPFLQMMILPFMACSHREGGGGTLSTKIMEMAVIKVSHLNGCNY
ncbi:MAG: hypothetical protein ACKVHL_01385 [Rhodospirillales bacterium]|jgi:hypothetical protein